MYINMCINIYKKTPSWMERSEWTMERMKMKSRASKRTINFLTMFYCEFIFYTVGNYSSHSSFFSSITWLDYFSQLYTISNITHFLKGVFGIILKVTKTIYTSLIYQVLNHHHYASINCVDIKIQVWRAIIIAHKKCNPNPYNDWINKNNKLQ